MVQISYEYYLEKEHNKHPLPKYSLKDRVMYKAETIEVLIIKPIDYDTEEKEWRYQAISTITNEHCFFWEHQLEKII